jgi:hypothetical protein
MQYGTTRARKGQADPERQGFWKIRRNAARYSASPITSQAASDPTLDLATAVQSSKPTTWFGPFRCAALP